MDGSERDMNQGKVATPFGSIDYGSRRRLRLGEVLVSEGLATETEIQVALKQQKI